MKPVHRVKYLYVHMGHLLISLYLMQSNFSLCYIGLRVRGTGNRILSELQVLLVH